MIYELVASVRAGRMRPTETKRGVRFCILSILTIDEAEECYAFLRRSAWLSDRVSISHWTEILGWAEPAA